MLEFTKTQGALFLNIGKPSVTLVRLDVKWPNLVYRKQQAYMKTKVWIAFGCAETELKVTVTKKQRKNVFIQ